MNDKVKSSVTTSYMTFIFGFADPHALNKHHLEIQVGPASELFKNQQTADKAKRILGKEGFKEILSLYFSSFQNQDGLDHLALEEELDQNKKVILRHLGQDKYNYLSLLVKISKALDEKERKGLLIGRAS